MATVTGQQIREELLQWGLLTKLGTTTVASTAADHLRDSIRMMGRTVSPETYHGSWVRMTSGGTGTTDGQISRIDEVDPSTGTIWVSPSFTIAPATSTTYEIYRPDLEPDDVDRARDKGLEYLCSRWQILPVSIVTNADYLVNVTDGWTATDTTLSRPTQAFPTELWPATMLATNSGASGNARSASIYAIREEDFFYLYVPVSVRSGTAQVIVRDITNGADIDLNGNTSETRRGWSGFEITGQLPSGCDEIQVWLQGDEADAIVEWGPIFFQPQNWRRIQLPERVDSKEKVGHVYRLTRLPTASGLGMWDESAREEIPGVRRVQVNDTVHLQLHRNTVGINLPHLYDERVFYTALQTAYQTAANRGGDTGGGDIATTDCPLDYAVAATVKVLCEQKLGADVVVMGQLYGQKESVQLSDDEAFWLKTLQLAESRLARAEKLYGPEPKPSLEREREIIIPYYRV